MLKLGGGREVPCFWFRGRLPTLWAQSGLIPGRTDLQLRAGHFVSAEVEVGMHDGVA